MSHMLNVSCAPHVRSKDSTHCIMFDVAIALLPATAFCIFLFGFRALIIMLVSIAACVGTEYLYQRGMKQKITIEDGSALVTGMLLGLNLSVEVPWWIPLLGGIFAVLVVKQLFGGLGQNFMNPALAARCFLLISFAGRMTRFSCDGVSGATPLALLKNGEQVNVTNMFLGFIGGTIGEVSALAVLIGAAYLVWRKVISLRIPLTYIGTFALFVLLFGGHGLDFSYLGAQLFGGGLMLGAFFMATDYVTSPITPNGQIIFGVMLGVLTGIFRIFGASAEGVSYAIIFCNMLVPLIERVTLPAAFGKEKAGNGK